MSQNRLNFLVRQQVGKAKSFAVSEPKAIGRGLLITVLPGRRGLFDFRWVFDLLSGEFPAISGEEAELF